MNDHLFTSKTGQEFIKAFESVCLKPYDDNGKAKGGFPTIGYGHKIKLGEEILLQGISESQAEQLFQLDLLIAEKIVKSKFTIPLNQNQFDSLVSFAFNTGKMSGNLRRLITNNAPENEIKEWWTSHYTSSAGIVLNGLMRRRLAESNNYFKIQTL